MKRKAYNCSTCCIPLMIIKTEEHDGIEYVVMYCDRCGRNKLVTRDEFMKGEHDE